MPRPSMKDQRSEEILDAYLTCVARFGLEGATQERIASEAGVKRPLLRHYLGNREQMVAALNDHVIATFNALTQDIDTAMAYVETPKGMVDLLFDADAENDPRLLLAWQALSATSVDHEEMRAALLDSLKRFLDVLVRTLQRLAPEAGPETIRAVAHGISSSFVTLDSLAPLSPPAGLPDIVYPASALLPAGAPALHPPRRSAAG